MARSHWVFLFAFFTRSAEVLRGEMSSCNQNLDSGPPGGHLCHRSAPHWGRSWGCAGQGLLSAAPAALVWGKALRSRHWPLSHAACGVMLPSAVIAVRVTKYLLVSCLLPRKKKYICNEKHWIVCFWGLLPIVETLCFVFHLSMQMTCYFDPINKNLVLMKYVGIALMWLAAAPQDLALLSPLPRSLLGRAAAMCCPCRARGLPGAPHAVALAPSVLTNSSSQLFP